MRPMAYSAQVEQWRPLVEKYFPPELVDKALYVINGESGGDPNRPGDGGAARGLFQIQDSRNFPNRPDAAYLDDPENNIRYAAEVLGAAGGDWSAWGEGTEKYDHPYDPATGTGYFGALGHNPYPGGSGGSSYSSEQLPFGEKEYLEKYVRYQTLLDQYNRAQSTVDPLTGAPQAFDPNLLNEMFTLEYELSEYDRIKSEGGTGLDDELARLDYWNKNNPALIDAQNSANEWARQQTLNDMAQSGTKTALQEQRLTQDSANAETAAYKGSSVFTAPMGFRVGSTDLPTEDEVFAKQMEMASSRLPEVKPIPYAAPYPNVSSGARPYQAPPPPDWFNGGGTPSTHGQWQGPINPDKPQGPINPHGEWQGPIDPSQVQGPMNRSVFRSLQSPLDTLRSTLLGNNPSLVNRNPPAPSAPPVPSRAPVPTGTPTPYSTPSPYSQQSRLASGLRRYVGSIFS